MASKYKITDFVVGLKSDDKDLKSGLKEADKSIGEFVAGATKMLGAISIGAGFKSIVQEFVTIGNELKMFSDSTGIAVEDVSKLGLALENFGGDTSNAQATLQGLQDSIRSAVDWGSGPLMDVMGRYGLSLYKSNGQIKNATELYYSLADKMQYLSKAQQIDLARSLGIDEASIRLLQQGRAGIDEVMASLNQDGVITAEDAETARELQMTINSIITSFKSLGRSIARMVLPILQKLSDFFKNIADFVKNNLEIALIGLGVAFSSSVSKMMIPAIKMLGRSLGGLMIKLAPLTAIALLIDDLAVFLSGSGGKSVIGELLGDNGEKVREIISGAFGKISDFFGELFSGIAGVFKKLLVGDFKGAVNEIINMWKTTIIPMLMSVGGAIWDGFKWAIEKIKDGLGKLWGYIKKLFGFGEEEITPQNKSFLGEGASNITKTIADATSGKPISSVAGATNNTSNKAVTINNNNKIEQTFNGNVSANEVKKGTEQAIDKTNNNLVYGLTATANGGL